MGEHCYLRDVASPDRIASQRDEVIAEIVPTAWVCPKITPPILPVAGATGNAEPFHGSGVALVQHAGLPVPERLEGCGIRIPNKRGADPTIDVMPNQGLHPFRITQIC